MGLTELLPPPELTSRIGGSQAEYHAIGRIHVSLIRELLPEDWKWAGVRVLDFGCGAGRTLAQFQDEATEAEFWGCDIDAPSIGWANAHLAPPFHFLLNSDEPPVALPDAHFDLIYGMSVFTHLGETWSSWLLEVHRLLRVGGFGLFTFLGEGMIADVAGRRN